MKKMNLRVLVILLLGIIVISCSSEKEYVTEEFNEFTNELISPNYNKVKFKIKQKEFANKWVVIDGFISDIKEDGSISIDIVEKNKTFNFDANFDFGSPEKVINFKQGQYIIIEAKFIEAINEEYYDFDYHYYFEDPFVFEKEPKDLKIMWTDKVTMTDREHYDLLNPLTDMEKMEKLMNDFDSVMADVEEEKKVLK